MTIATENDTTGFDPTGFDPTGFDPAGFDPAGSDPAGSDTTEASPAVDAPASTPTGMVGDPPPEIGDEVEVRVTGRHVDVPDHFRERVTEKVRRVERYESALYRLDVELTHEKNRRQSKSCQRVEITAFGVGPVIRGEACADNFYAALEAATDKLESRMRRAKDRRTVHRGRHTPISVAEATAGLADTLAPLPAVPAEEPEPESASEFATGPGQVVRVKEHAAVPMSVDDALYEMELVGHDFFLFHDAGTDRPSVVYRRHAFDYGVIRLA